jgi:hypothetical protein
MTVLAIDPGETVGVAVFTERGKAITLNEYPSDEFFDRLAEYQPGKLTTVVVEDYRLRQGKQMQQTGSRFETVQCIGAARLFALIHGLDFHRQSPQILTVTAKHMHIHLPSGHIQDRTSALLHGYRFFIESRGFETATLREINALS